MLLAINLPHVGLSTPPAKAAYTVTIPAGVRVEVGEYVPPDSANRWTPAPPNMATTRHLYEEDVDLLATVETVQPDYSAMFEEASELTVRNEVDIRYGLPSLL